jgi:lysophospholipase L1-like esterase
MTRERLFKVLVPLLTVVVTLLLAETVARGSEPMWGEKRRLRLSAKEPGARRILFYGESTVFGTPSPPLGFVAQLGYYLRERDPETHFDIVNLGAPGISSTELLERVRESLNDDADLVFLAVGHNEFLNLQPTGVRTTALGRASALYRSIQTLKTRISPRKRDLTRVDPPYLEPVDRSSEYYRERKRTLEENVAAIVRETKDAGVPLVIATLGSNLKDWPPVFRRLPPAFRDSTYEREASEALTDLASGRLDRAQSFSTRILTQHPTDAMGLFVRGRILLAEGKAKEAHDTLIAAKDADPMPWRAVSEFNDAVARIARAEQVPVIALQDSLAVHATGGSPGFELYCDNVHPTPEGNAIVARLLLAEIERRFSASPSNSVGTACCSVERYWSHLGGEEAKRTLLTDYLIRNGQYAMKPPFFSYPAARMYFERADSLSPRNWKVETNLASVDLLEGRRQAGLDRLKSALDHAAQAGKTIDPRNLGDAPYLWKALRTAGVDLDSIHARR